MAAGVMTTGSFPRLLLPGIREIFGTELKQLPEVFRKVFDVKSSERNYEEYVQLAGIGIAAEKGEGASIEYDSAKQDFAKRFIHIRYGKGMRMTREIFEDDLYATVSQLMSTELAKSLSVNKDTICANVLNNGFNSNFKGGDQKELFALDHPIHAGGTEQNEPTTAVDLSEAALEAAIIDIYDFIGPDGLRVDVSPVKLVLPHNLMFEAHRILKGMYQSGTANNDPNALYDMGLMQDIVTWRRLTDTDAWFIINDRKPGLCFYQRTSPNVDTQNDFDTLDAKYIAHERFSVGWADFRGAYGSPGA